MSLLIAMLLIVTVSSSSIDHECAHAPPMGQSACWENNITRLVTADKLLDVLDGKNNYSRMVPPTDVNGDAVTVWTALYIESMSSFKAETMDYEADMYLAYAWFDYRLKHNYSEPIMINDFEFSKKLWIPDLYFVNSKTSTFQSIILPNFMVLVYPDGLVFRSARLEWFKKDNRSGGYPISHNKNIQLNDMVMQYHGKTTGKCIEFPYPMFRGQGYWDCLVGYIRMKRRIGFYVFQTYVPSSMLVCISWLSFWLDPRAAPARITLPITTLLTLVSVSNGALQGLPQVSYIKALDIWLTVSTGFIFCTLLEYTIVNYVTNSRPTTCNCQLRTSLNKEILLTTSQARSNRRTGNKLLMLNCLSRSISKMRQNMQSGRRSIRPCLRCMQSCQKRAKRVDHVSRVLFPLLFAVFAGMYWGHYWYEYKYGRPVQPVANDYGAGGLDTNQADKKEN